MDLNEYSLSTDLDVNTMYANEYDIYLSIFNTLLDQEILIYIFNSFINNNHNLLLESLISTDEVIQTLISLTYDHINQNNTIDTKSTQDVAIDLLIDRFNAINNAVLSNAIKSILVDCSYDIELATNQVLKYLDSGLVDSSSYPTLQDSICILKSAGKDIKYQTNNDTNSFKSKITNGSSKPIIKSFNQPKQTFINSQIVKLIDKNIDKPKIIIVDQSSNHINSNQLKQEALYWRSKAQDEWVNMKLELNQPSLPNKFNLQSNRYADISNKHSQYINLYNKRAAVCILKSNNNNHIFDVVNDSITYIGKSSNNYSPNIQIDFHEITINESIELIESIIRYLYNHNISSKCIFIVGLGNHNKFGKSILGPGICKYLQSKGYSYEYSKGAITTKL